MKWNLNLKVTSLLVIASVSCSSDDRKKSSNESAVETTNEEENIVQLDPDSISRLSSNRQAIRNFEQLMLTFAQLTCVPIDDEEYLGFYEGVKGSLPTDNNVESFVAASQVATINLASKACELSLENSFSEACGWSGGMSRAGIAQILDPTARLDLAKAQFSSFWGVKAADVSASQAEVVSFNSLMDELLQSAKRKSDNVDVSTQVKALLVGTCTATLSSVQTTMY